MPVDKVKELKNEVKKLRRKVRYLEKKTGGGDSNAQLKKFEVVRAHLKAEIDKWRTMAKRLQDQANQLPLPQPEKARMGANTGDFGHLVHFGPKS